MHDSSNIALNFTVIFANVTVKFMSMFNETFNIAISRVTVKHLKLTSCLFVRPSFSIQQCLLINGVPFQNIFHLNCRWL